MDLFEAGCQGLGLALASGVVFGAAGAEGRTGYAFGLLAVTAGAVAWGLSLGAADHPAWPGAFLGAAAGAFSYAAARGVAAGARSRGGEGGVAGIVGATGLLLAGFSLLGPAAYASLAALAALIWLAVARRRKAGDKHAGLRALR